MTMGSVSKQQFAGDCAKAAKTAQEEVLSDSARAAEGPQLLHGVQGKHGVRLPIHDCPRWGLAQAPVDVFVHQSRLHMEGSRSLKEGEAVEFTFKKSAKGLESMPVTGPGGLLCIESEQRPKGRSLQKRRSKGDRSYNCGGLDHHAKECSCHPSPRSATFAKASTIG